MPQGCFFVNVTASTERKMTRKDELVTQQIIGNRVIHFTLILCGNYIHINCEKPLLAFSKKKCIKLKKD